MQVCQGREGIVWAHGNQFNVRDALKYHYVMHAWPEHVTLVDDNRSVHVQCKISFSNRAVAGLVLGTQRSVLDVLSFYMGVPWVV